MEGNINLLAPNALYLYREGESVLGGQGINSKYRTLPF